MGAGVVFMEQDTERIACDGLDCGRVSRYPATLQAGKSRGVIFGIAWSIAPMLQFSNDRRIVGDARRMGDFFGDEEIEFTGGLSRQRFEAFSADFPDFLRSLPEC